MLYTFTPVEVGAESLTIKSIDMNRILRILKVTHFRTPLNIKVGVAVLGLIIAPAVISVTARVIELGWRIKMYL